MDSVLRRYCKLILLIALLAEAQNSSSDQSLPELRRPRTTGRIVKLYGGYKSEPITCTREGFHGDPKDCGIFYRCTQSGNGKFTVFKFQCGPGTVYDPETEVCNYPQSTKRLECGGLSNDENEIDEIQQEFSASIITKVPIYNERTTVHQKIENDNTHENLINPITNKKQDLNNTTNTTVTSSSHSWNQYSSSPTIQPSPPTTNPQTSNTLHVTSDVGVPLNEKPNWQNNLCISDGFMGDYENCHKFYRCVRNQIGGFTKYEFSCSDFTVWDDDIQACNHPWAVRRSRCGKSGSNIGSTKLLSIVPQTTSPKNLHFSDNHNNTKDQKQFDNIPNLYQSQTSNTIQPKVKNQIQINYGNRIYKLDKKLGNQNETNVKETQSQIINKNDVTQTQLPTDHSNQLPQAPTTITDSSTKSSSSFYNNEDKYLTHINAQNSNQCTYSGFIGDPNNCKIFYRCVDNGKGGYTRYEFSCGEGTFWDQNLEACNHAWAVKHCGSEQSLQETEITSPSATKLSSSTIKPTQSYITSTKTTEKHKFEETDDNDKNVDYNDHNPDDLTTTLSHTLFTTTVNILQNANNECRSSGFMGDTMNCKIFYRCIDDGKGGYIKHRFECGEGTVWDPHIEACNYPEIVENCGGNMVMSTEATTSKGTTALNNNNITEPPYVTTTQFQINTELPDDRFEVSTGTVLQNNNTFSNECKSAGFFGVKNDCKKFYRCVVSDKGDFKKYDFSCGEGTVWIQETQSCEHNNRVINCSLQNETNIYKQPDDFQHTSSSIVITLMTSTLQPVITSNDNSATEELTSNVCTSEGYHNDKQNCIKFYRCVDNGNGGFTKFEFICGEGTAWDVIIGGCNHIHLVESCQTSSSTSESITVGAVYSTSTTMTISNAQNSNSTDIDENCNSDCEDDCSEEGYFGNTSDCKKFYRCVDDGKDGYMKYDFTCGDGTIWDDEIAACNHPQDIKNPSCESSTEENSTTDYTTSINTTTISTTTQPVTITTPKGEQLLNTTQESSKQPVNSNYTCSEAGYFPNPNDCKKFYRCVDDGKDEFIKYDFICGDGTIWDQDIDACNHPQDVKNSSCKSSTEENSTTDFSTSMNTTTISTTTQLSTVTTQNGEQLPNSTQEPSKQPVSSNYTCSEAGYFPNPNDCKMFYQCVDDGKDGFIKYDFICGDGTIWDQNINACNHPHDVENPSCKSSTEINSTTDCTTSMNTTTVSTTTQPSTITTENGEQLLNTTQEPSKQPVNDNFTCSEAGYFPNPNDCKKFYQCVDDGKDGYIKYDFTCGDGTIWDDDIDACNHPQDVENPSCKSTTEKNSTTECTTSMNTSTVLTTTQASTITTQNGEQLPNTTQETTMQPVNNNITCTQAGYFPNPNDCKKFYRCVDWDGDGSKFSIFHFECGTGTIWDPKLETCNHEESVVPPRVCNSTQSQTENSEHGNSTTEATTIKDITTQQTTVSSAQTTMQTTIQQTTTSECNTTQQTTTQQPSTTDKTTTLESTTSIQTTSEPTTIHQQTTTTTSQTTTNEQSTTKQSTITAESTTQQSITTTTEKEYTSKKPIRTTTEKEHISKKPITTTTEKEYTSKKPIRTTTEKEYTSKKPIKTTTEKEYTSKKPITTTQMSSKSTTIENTTTQKSTTEQTTQQTTVNNTTTTEQTTSTESSTTDGLILTTTQSSTETSTNKGDQETTTENTSTSVHKCPETDEEQLLFVCPTSFRRHPKYCNLFYQCTEEDDTHDAKIAVFTCPNNTIYDESKVQCVEENKTEKSCDGEISSRRRVKRLGFLYKESIVVTTDTHSCSATGYVPFEKNSECSPAFLKCEKSKSGKLRGYVYQCPQNYIYWSISRKCERREFIKDCKRSTNNWVGRWEIPIEKHNVAW